MEKKFLNIEELSQYIGIKKSNLYSKVEKREIPFYKWGRLIMFNKDEVDAFMEKCRIETVDLGKEAKRIMKGERAVEVDISRIVRRAVDDAKEKPYTLSHGKPDQLKGLRKEVKAGTL